MELEQLREKINSIEREVNRRFDEIEDELKIFKTESTKQNSTEHDERFFKLCHAIDYLLENSPSNYDTLACREMILSLLGQRSTRPFSGRTIRNRQLCRRMKRWCLLISFILFVVICLSFYGLHRHWCYFTVAVCLIGSILSSISLRRICKILELIW